MLAIRNVIFAIAICLSVGAHAEGPLGSRCYNTNFGQVTLIFLPLPKIVGTYTYGGGGAIVGDLEGHKMIGVWNEPLATEYPTIGDVEFEFNNDYSNFSGRYRFKDGEWKEWSGLETTCAGADANSQPKSAPRSSGHHH